MATMIEFMAKLSPELLDECVAVCANEWGPGEEPALAIANTAATIKAVRAAMGVIDPKKPGRPRGSRNRKLNADAIS